MMMTTRLLLPFTHGIDGCAIEQAIRLAKAREATLIPVALIYVPERRRTKGVRLEHVQQSKDFLELTKHKAARNCVPIERFEVVTSDVVQSINLVASEMKCESILLFAGSRDGILLHADEIKRLLGTATCKLYIMRLQSNESQRFTQALSRLFSHWLPGKRKNASIGNGLGSYAKG
jgi:hypothetical protein